MTIEYTTYNYIEQQREKIAQVADDLHSECNH